MSEQTDLPSPNIANAISQPDHDTLPTDQPAIVPSTDQPTGIGQPEPELLDTSGETASDYPYPHYPESDDDFPPSYYGVDIASQPPEPLAKNHKPGQQRDSVSTGGFVSYVAQFNEAGVEIQWESRYQRLIELMNQHHAKTIIGGKTRVMKVTTNIEGINKGHNQYEFIAPKEFTQLYSAFKIQTGMTDGSPPKPIIKDYATAWLSNPYQQIYGDGVVFRPGQELPVSYYNMWQGFAVEPQENLNLVALTYIYWHIEQIICGGDPALIQYCYDWMAYTFQHPDKPAGAALVFRGLKGCGKGTIAQLLLNLWGKHGLTVTSTKHLTGNFNAHLMDACFLFADEAFFSGDKAGENTLKALITESTIRIEPKGIDVFQQPNYLKIIMSTNHDWAVPASRDERRYCVFDVSGQKHGDRDYFKTLHAAIENQEVQAAFLYDMLQRDLSQYHSGNIPESKGLQDQRMHSLHSAGKWLLDSLHNGYFEAKDGSGRPCTIEWSSMIRASDLWNSYIFWCDEARKGEHHRMTQKVFGKYLGEVGFTGRKISVNHWVLGTIEEATAKFKNYERIDF